MTRHTTVTDLMAHDSVIFAALRDPNRDHDAEPSRRTKIHRPQEECYFCAVTWVAVITPSASAVPCTVTVAPTGMSFADPVCCTRTAVVEEVFTVMVDPSEPVR